MNNIIITIKKELRSIVRDKKTFITLLAMPLIGMFFVIVYGVMFDQNQVLEPYKVGIDFEPNIIENIVSSEYQLETVKYDNLGEMEKSYKDKDINAYIDYNKEEKKYYFYTDNSQDGYQLQSLIKGYFESLKNNELITYVAGEGIDYEEINAKYPGQDKAIDRQRATMDLYSKAGINPKTGIGKTERGSGKAGGNAASGAGEASKTACGETGAASA